MPSDSQIYLVRKLARHYRDEVSKFIADREGGVFVDWEDETVANAIKIGPDSNGKGAKLRNKFDENGTYYFSAKMGDKGVTPDSIVIGGYLEFVHEKPTESRLPYAAQSAFLKHFARREEKIVGDYELLNEFFCAMETASSAMHLERLYVSTSTNSWLSSYLAKRGYRILMHGFVNVDDIRLVYYRQLVPGYVGDPRDWTALCRWYLDFSFGKIGDLQPGAVPDDQKISVVKYNLSRRARSGEPSVSPTCSAITNAIIVPRQKDEVPADKLSRLLLENATNLLFSEEDIAGEIGNRAGRVGHKDVVALLRETRDHHLRQLPAETLGNVRYDAWREAWYDRTLGIGKGTRKALIVEIDRESYKELLQKKTADTDDHFIFLNNGGVAELDCTDKPVFFYVWDAFPPDPDSDSRPDLSVEAGIVVAVGTLEKVEVFDDVASLNLKWDEYKRHAIWKEPFASEYFDGRIAVLRVTNLFAVVPDEADKGWIALPGVAYREILKLLFSSDDSTINSAYLSRARLLPSRDIGDIYLNNRQKSALHEKLKESAKLKQFFPGSRGGGAGVAPASDGARPGYKDKYRTDRIEWREKTEKLPNLAPKVALSVSRGHDDLLRLFRENIDGTLLRNGYDRAWHFSAERKTKNLWMENVGEAFRDCAAAVVFLSPSFMASDFCRDLELPYLLWKWGARKDFMLKLVKLTDFPDPPLIWPDFDLDPRLTSLKQLYDDRHEEYSPAEREKSYDRATIKALMNAHQDGIVDRRFTQISSDIVDHLKKMK
jgi:hypothetical protein